MEKQIEFICIVKNVVNTITNDNKFDIYAFILSFVA